MPPLLLCRLLARSSWNAHCCIHTTATLPKSTRKVVREPILLKTKREVVIIWKNMTVDQLASAIGKDLDTVFDMFAAIPNTKYFYRRSSKIFDIEVLKIMTIQSGFRPHLSLPPGAAKVTSKRKKLDIYRRPPADPSSLVSRPPVITIMGHVDHGKTTLLDNLRKSSIVDAEFGGITQHIGAFQFCLPNGSPITVLDTPGHAAFSAMRGRGANVTDIAVLVVAADDGVMQQTLESIQHANNAGVPIVVAINKIDKVDADVEMTRRSLLNAGVQLEEDGGDVQGVEISARQGTNIDLLVDAVLMQAEMLKLGADPNGPVEATVIESNTDKLIGKVATCLVHRGTLRPGAILVAGTVWGRVRTMQDEHGTLVKEAGPARPVQVCGWKELPGAGDLVLEVTEQRKARQVVEARLQDIASAKKMKDQVAIDQRRSKHAVQYKEALQAKLNIGIKYKLRRTTAREKERPEIDSGPNVSLILKCDVDGSLEAIMEVLETYDSNSVKLSLISSGVGPVTPTDVTLANAFGGSIYTFNVATERSVRDLAHSLGVTIVDSNIIYMLVEQLRKQLQTQLPLLYREKVLGEAEVREEFLVDGKRKIPVAGCHVMKGLLNKKEKFKVVRGEDIIHEGPLSSIRLMKSEVQSIGNDKECGLRFENESVRFEKDDRIVCYTLQGNEQECDWNPPGF